MNKYQIAREVLKEYIDEIAPMIGITPKCEEVLTDIWYWLDQQQAEPCPACNDTGKIIGYDNSVGGGCEIEIPCAMCEFVNEQQADSVDGMTLGEVLEQQADLKSRSHDLKEQQAEEDK